MRSREVEHSEDEPKPGPSLEENVPGIKFLASLMKATIFTDLFVYHADLRYEHATRAQRISALIEHHPRFYNWCRKADFGMRGGLVVVSVLLVGTAAWGTIIRLFFA
jgi:hypothetical protein